MERSLGSSDLWGWEAMLPAAGFFYLTTRLGVTGKDLYNLLVERVAEATAGGAEEAGAQGETFPFFIII